MQFGTFDVSDHRQGSDFTVGRLTARIVLAYFAVAMVIAVGVTLLVTRSETPREGKQVTVTLNGSPVRAVVAATEESRARGLMGRKRLGPDEGMLFVFDGAPRRRSFWMRGVRFPLDMIWISAGRVIGVTHGARPASDTADGPLYLPPAPVDRVLEVPGGWAVRNQVGTGDAVLIG